MNPYPDYNTYTKLYGRYLKKGPERFFAKMNPEGKRILDFCTGADFDYHCRDFTDTISHRFDELVKRFGHEFAPIKEGYVFGTIAVKIGNNRLLTTGRGKNELNDRVFVMGIDHDKRKVISEKKKPSLNTPLLHWIFTHNPKVKAIVHYHRIDNTFPTLEYAPPGTVRDSQRGSNESFNIKNHGCFLLLDNQLNVII